MLPTEDNMPTIITNEPYNEITVNKLTEILQKRCGTDEEFIIKVAASWQRTYPCITIICSNEHIAKDSLEELKNSFS